MMPLAASPLYGFLYKKTVATFPGAFLLFNVSLYLVVKVLTCWVYWAMKRAGVLAGSDVEQPFNQMEVVENKERLLQV